MKLLISIALCTVLLSTNLSAETGQTNGVPGMTACEAAFVLGILAMAGYAIYTVAGKVPGQHCPTTFVLEKSTDGRATWQPVSTNTVVLNGTNAIEFFTDYMNDPMAFYRARWVKNAQHLTE